MSDGDVVNSGVDKLAIHDDDEEVDSSYKPPPEKSIEELLSADKEDESLQKYKEKLLGDANTGKIIYGTSARADSLGFFLSFGSVFRRSRREIVDSLVSEPRRRRAIVKIVMHTK